VKTLASLLFPLAGRSFFLPGGVSLLRKAIPRGAYTRASSVGFEVLSPPLFAEQPELPASWGSATAW